jgi:hypothetical protein
LVVEGGLGELHAYRFLLLGLDVAVVEEDASPAEVVVHGGVAGFVYFCVESALEQDYAPGLIDCVAGDVPLFEEVVGRYGGQCFHGLFFKPYESPFSVGAEEVGVFRGVFGVEDEVFHVVEELYFL